MPIPTRDTWPACGLVGRRSHTFVAAEARRLNSDIDPMSGLETEQAMAAILATPKPMIADVQAALGVVP